MPSTVLIVGDVMVDIVVNMPGEMIRGSDMPSEISTTFGGTAANVATWIAKAGGSCRILGIIGKDTWGQDFREHLQSFGIEAHLTESATQPTGVVVALCHPDGERSFFPDARANSDLATAPVSEHAWSDVSHLYMSGYTLLNPLTRAWAVELMRTANSRQVTVVLDPASSGPLAALPASELKQWLAAADVLLPNDQESEVLRSKIERSDWGVAHVVTKHGAKGATVESADSCIELDAPTLQIIDTIGAGDAFAAGLLTGLADGQGLADAAALAIKVASAAVQIRGAQPALSSTLELS